MTDNTAEFLPIRRAAAVLGCSHASLYNAIVDGRLSWEWKENGNRMVKMIRVENARGMVRATRGRPPLSKEAAPK